MPTWAGAAAVAGLMLVLARQESPVHAVGILGIAENLPSGSALKPREVITTLSGQTVEVSIQTAKGGYCWPIAFIMRQRASIRR